MPDNNESPGKRAQGRRHRLCVLVTDLCESKRLCEAMEAEQFSELVANLHDIWQDVVGRFAGLIQQTQGDGANILFGYPVPADNDGRRAAEAALEIHRRVAELAVEGLPPGSLPLAMHSGIASGTLLLSEGDLERGRFVLTGDAINAAAHLCKSASRGEIRATREALGPDEHFFVWAAVPGAAAPHAVGSIVGRSTAASRYDATARRGLTPLIGRHGVIDRLAAHLTSDEVPLQRCAEVVGPAGIGKTRVLEELARRSELSGCRVLRGACENYLAAEVLQPFLQMLRTQPGSGRLPDKGAQAEWIERITGRDGDRPSVLLLDDWQWADDASRQLLELLLRQPNCPRVVLASRPRDDGTTWISGALHIDLTPFEESETGMAMRRWLDPDPFLVARIHSYTGGIPLFIEELCHSVPPDRLVHATQGRGATQTWLATLVASRTGRLTLEQATTLRAAAVIGNAVPLKLLRAACMREPSQETVRALASADFLYADAEHELLRFKHGITRDAIYEATDLHERNALHQRVLLALENASSDPDAEDRLEALAYHSRGAAHWEQASLYAEKAGDKASAAFALDRARTQYVAAMQALDRVPDRSPALTLRWCTISNKLGMTCIFDPLSLDGDLSVFLRAVSLAESIGDPQAIARARYWLGYMCYGFGRFREGVAHARQGLELSRQIADTRLAAQIEATLGQILAGSSEYDEALRLMDQALALKRQGSRPGGGIAIGSAYTLACKGSVLADRGDFVAAHRCFDEAMELLGGSTHPVANSVRNWVAIALIWQERWDEAGHWASESARIAENTRSLLLLVVCRAAAGFARWAGGDGVGLTQLRDAVRWMESRRGQFYTSLYYGWLAEACVAEGQIEEARRYVAHVLRRTRAGERLGEAVASRAMAIVEARAGHAQRAQRWLARAERSARLRASSRESRLNEQAMSKVRELLETAHSGRAGTRPEGVATPDADIGVPAASG